MFIPDPGSDFSPSRIRIHTNEFKYFILTQKIAFKALGKFIRVVHRYRILIRIFTHPGSRIQGSKRHRIPDPDPQHCYIVARMLLQEFNNFFVENR